MEIIGGSRWLEKAERKWDGRGDREFDPVRAFRGASLREASALRPRRWWGGAPWVLCDHSQRSSLHPKFVAYLDNHAEMQDWQQMIKELRHHDLQWWADRYEEAQAAAPSRSEAEHGMPSDPAMARVAKDIINLGGNRG